MAAISCYQPCRSHLAQPARCLDVDEDCTPAALALRRRQFIERCHEARPARVRDQPAAEVQISVKKTREELTKNATQTTAPLNRRRLNVDSGWSKVEEVRKKFEGATAVTSFSRSFESPPRRRLADSLFASFKLPRRKQDATMSASRSYAPQTHAQPKRKSAVELLAETKAFYVKSETVLDRKQEIPLRVSSGLSQAIAAGGCHLVSSGTLNNDIFCNNYGTTPRTHVARRAVSAGEGLQSTLRRLLDHTDSRENVYSPPIYAVPHKVYPDVRRSKDAYDGHNRSQLTSGTYSGTSSSGTSGCVGVRAGIVRVRSAGDPLPTTRAPDLPSPQSSGESGGAEQIGTISPPPQYAHSAPRYTRSNSQSQASVRDEDDETQNINSHKSLPDLHMQTRCYPEHVNVGTDTIGRSPRRRRHSNHQRTASCSSKGTRSNHSSLLSSCEAFSEHPSPGEDSYPYNNGFARDSGGSSGHYTQRSSGHHIRTDSTQDIHHHYSCGVVCAPAQFQDGAPSPPAAPSPDPHPAVSMHFQASVPPPQFQDIPYYDTCGYNAQLQCLGVGPRNEYLREYKRYHEPNTEVVSKQPQQDSRMRPRNLPDTQDYVNAQQLCGNPEEVTSPLGTFKRQRCLRFKQRKPRPILRSKSDISDRYRRPEPRSASSAPCEGSSSSSVDSTERLTQFFSWLGMDQRSYSELVTCAPPTSPVYLSSVSSLDSNHSQDYTVQGSQQKQIFRNTEPPSVVERNARIVKWLCQCRKQMQGT